MEYSQILKDLRRETSSVKNRIQSIIFDTKYVAQFNEFPIVANERCGVWYVEPNNTTASVYFKSTDGHTGQWRFSMRRLNFHMLDLFQQSSTLVLVDSTRKGKLMPDALSKTVPIWCAVLNYIMFEDDAPSGQWESLVKDNWLCTPAEMVSRSEHSSIVKLIPQHAREVQKLGLISKDDLIRKLGTKKPILPHWIYPGKASQLVKSSPDVHSICCLTASYKSSSGTNVPGWNFAQPYVQGAADDHELWASSEICDGRLDHDLLWNHIYYEPSEELRVVDMISGDICSWLSEDEFLTRITKIYQSSKVSEETLRLDISALKNTGIVIGVINKNLAYSEITKSTANLKNVVVLSPDYSIVEVPKDCGINITTHKVESSKKGSKQLREMLPSILSAISTVNEEEKALVLCDSVKICAWGWL
ncbi:hypothetical protein JCM33374_g6144 [Metschnikowia sp. JCM 33374]|nr:hypothetical protein JCM33374_g6144 [Metschnikowia sp. JCM 33374]